MKYQKTFLFIIIILVSQLLFSCFHEKKIAKEFLKKKDYGSILVLSPKILYMSNLKIDEIKNAENLDQYVLDSLLYYNSKYLQYISDSVFVENYINNMLEEFQNLGFETYTEEYFDVFLSLQTPSYILNISQLELEEYMQEITDEDYFNGFSYHINKNVNTVGIYSWLEFSEVNSSEDRKEVLFADYEISDELSGYFRESFLSSEVKYEYIIDSLSVMDIYEHSSYLGRLYAQYLFDYLMNKEIEKQYNVQSTPPMYFHFDRIKNKLYTVEKSKFTIIK